VDTLSVSATRSPAVSTVAGTWDSGGAWEVLGAWPVPLFRAARGFVVFAGAEVFVGLVLFFAMALLLNPAGGLEGSPLDRETLSVSGAKGV
jgi:hypothetical protein